VDLELEAWYANQPQTPSSGLQQDLYTLFFSGYRVYKDVIVILEPKPPYPTKRLLSWKSLALR
jgi:hypothetical protein